MDQSALLRRPALSVRQPWAELILAGRKTIELRSWTPEYRGPLWLHTGVQDNPKLEEEYNLRGLFKGGYVGSVVLRATVPLDHDRWVAWAERHLDAGPFRSGVYAWLLSSPHRFALPFPAPGRLGLFHPPPELVALMWRADEEDRAPPPVEGR